MTATLAGDLRAAPDSLWLAIWGGPNGILCIPCFDARCRLRGIFVRFRVERL